MGSLPQNSDNEIVPRIEAILVNAKSLKQDDFAARLGLLRQIDDLYEALEPPINLFFKQWTSMTVFTCLEIAIRAGIFEKLKEKENMSAQELGEATCVDAGIIARAMRILVANRIVTSKSEDRYSHTPKSLIFTRGEHTTIDSFNLLTLLNKSYITIPNYITTRPSTDLLDIRKSPYACAYGMEGSTFYETISANPSHLETFNRSMNQPGPDYSIFPFASLRDEVLAAPHRPFVVDIGGGNGNALRFVKAATDNAFSCGAALVLQDRPDVLAEMTVAQRDGLQLMPYDFHDPQPVKDAHVYTLNQILHNYPDYLCADIVKQVRGAMGPTSRLLILDAILPAQTVVGGDMMGYLIDFVGLTMGGKERTEKEVGALLEAEGLEIVGVWHGKTSATSWQAVIEAKVKATRTG